MTATTNDKNDNGRMTMLIKSYIHKLTLTITDIITTINNIFQRCIPKKVKARFEAQEYICHFDSVHRTPQLHY